MVQVKYTESHSDYSFDFMMSKLLVLGQFFFGRGVVEITDAKGQIIVRRSSFGKKFELLQWASSLIGMVIAGIYFWPNIGLTNIVIILIVWAAIFSTVDLLSLTYFYDKVYETVNSKP